MKKFHAIILAAEWGKVDVVLLAYVQKMKVGL
jgi:hypothetical protein